MDKFNLLFIIKLVLLNVHIYFYIELDEYKEKMVDPSIYFNETLGITPESAIENKEKLLQMEELVESLEADVKILFLKTIFH